MARLHTCEVCGAGVLTWKRKCRGFDEDHDLGWCTECRQDIAWLLGQEHGEKQAQGYIEAMQLKRRLSLARPRKVE